MPSRMPLYTAEEGSEVREEERSNKRLGNVLYTSNTAGPWRGYEPTVCWLDLCVAHPATAAKGATTAR